MIFESDIKLFIFTSIEFCSISWLPDLTLSQKQDVNCCTSCDHMVNEYTQNKINKRYTIYGI